MNLTQTLAIDYIFGIMFTLGFIGLSVADYAVLVNYPSGIANALGFVFVICMTYASDSVYDLDVNFVCCIIFVLRTITVPVSDRKLLPVLHLARHRLPWRPLLRILCLPIHEQRMLASETFLHYWANGLLNSFAKAG